MDKPELKEIFEAIERLENMKSLYYRSCAAELEMIIRRRATAESVIDAMYERLLPFLTDQRFVSLFNELEDYVGSFDEKLALSYRAWYDEMEKDEQEQ